jgi:hypothetical protein
VPLDAVRTEERDQRHGAAVVCVQSAVEGQFDA